MSTRTRSRFSYRKRPKSKSVKSYRRSCYKRKRILDVPIQALKWDWVQHACLKEGVLMNGMLPQELRLNLISFIKNVIGEDLLPQSPYQLHVQYDIITKQYLNARIPNGLDSKPKSKYALTLCEFTDIVKEIYPNIVFEKGVLKIFHMRAEQYIMKLIKGGASLCKAAGENRLFPTYTNRIRLFYFPPTDD
jgi:hypothetical protein